MGAFAQDRIINRFFLKISASGKFYRDGYEGVATFKKVYRYSMVIFGASMQTLSEWESSKDTSQGG